ncbi:MAG: ABC transporter permease [Lentilactobacillus buchneri]|jgi:hypothetical protein|uniref:ABC transporter permease n=1 Tax=Lentilactobacillus hilgardii TaxID=1588 RepID=UPI0021A528AE|nr:ABC transporter permease [Lentilactobacillus hilgardii]MCI1922697.1 ABC transporter permease [Lentilactobacillus buchneri]MCI1950307.1 ABC transporter permease [Lentilactobacillus buchneri]MCI2018317.1 ABC transporter permease [Lentilactobacillus buchneri]MCI2027733.1 ABC transporter permease [Lentilactobacillus buchneri]MCT3397958.1 ABC transporter permease [Lentilactobacillus hilgardii]
MKTSQITKYLFKRQIVILGEMYLVTFAAIYILPLLLSLITGTLHDYSFVRILKTSPITGFFSFFMFVIATLSYENFKFLIQNGISRKTFFEAQITVYGLFILIGNTVNLVYNYLIYTPMTNRDTFNIFMTAYAKFFSNGIITVIFNFIFSALTLVIMTLIGMTIGSFLSLFSKTWQRILLVATPIIGGVTMIYIINALETSSLKMTWVEHFAEFILGYHRSGIYNPFPMMAFMLLISVIMLAIVRYLFSKKQLKRE